MYVIKYSTLISVCVCSLGAMLVGVQRLRKRAERE